MAPRRTINVPKIASQFGNAPLYEVLRDIVARMSERVNELEDRIGALTPGYLPQANGTSTLVDSPISIDKSTGRATIPTGLTVGDAIANGPLDVQGTGASTITSDAGGAIVATAQSALQLGLTNQTTQSGAAASLLFHMPNAAGTKSYWGRLSGYVDNPAAGSETGGLLLSVRTNAADTTATTEAVRVRPDTYTVLKPWDKGGLWHDIRAYGASTSATAATNTTAINAAITAAAATTPRGKVFIPWGTFKTTGGFALDGLDGLGFEGLGPGVSVLDLEHATNDLFTTTSTITSYLSFRNFTVTSSVARTAGWVFRVNNAYNGTGALLKSIFSNLEIKKQFNGLGLQKYAFLTLNDILIYDPASTSGVGLQFGQTTSTDVNQGSDVRCRNVHVYGAMLGDTSASLAAGILIEDCDAVVLEGCSTGGIAGTGLKIVANAGGHAPTNHFFLNSVFDATDTGHCAWVTGGQGVYRTKFNGCWFASAGAMAGTSNGNGLRVDVPMSGEITGCNFYVSRGTGLYIDATSAALAVTGNTFEGNGVGGGVNNNDAIYLNLPVNNLGPVLTGNQDLGSNGVSIRTGVTTNRIMVVGNRWVSGAAYGVAPLVNANNGA